MHFRIFSVVIFFVCISAFTTPVSAQYLNIDEVLTAGQKVTITVTQSDTLFITYRPGSNIAETQTLLLEGPQYEWLPEKAGIVSLSTPNGPSQTVSVRFNDFPFTGLFVFIIAGSILFGGAVFASIKLFVIKPSS